MAAGGARRRAAASPAAQRSAAPRIAVAVAFDGTRLPAMLWRVLAAELGRRLPGATIRRLTPDGLAAVHDDGVQNVSLTGSVPERLAAELDLLVVCGGLAGDAGAALVAAGLALAGRGVTVAWEGLVLGEAGPRPPAEAVETAAAAPSWVRLLGRTQDGSMLPRWVRHCELAGWLPPGGGAVVAVDDDAALAAQLSTRLRTQDGAAAVVLGRPGADAPDGAGPAVGAARLPWYAPVESWLAVASRTVDGVGDGARLLAEEGAAAAARLRGEPLGTAAAAAEAALDTRLDALAAAASASASRGGRSEVVPAPAPRPQPPGAGPVGDRTRLRAVERSRIAVEMRELEVRVAELEGECAQLPRLVARVRDAEAALERVTGSKTWRYTESARGVYRSLRARRGR